jgi:hypothetical protein
MTANGSPSATFRWAADERARCGGIKRSSNCSLAAGSRPHNATMALPRRRTRTLTVDGYVIRWRYTYRRHPDGDCVLIAQLAGGGMGARLVVLLPWRAPTGWLAGQLRKWPLHTAWAAECFRAARRHGWTPDIRGPEVCRTLPDLQLNLPLPPIAAKAGPPQIDGQQDLASGAGCPVRSLSGAGV